MGRHFTVKPQRIRGLGMELYNQRNVISMGIREVQEARYIIRGMSGMRDVCKALDTITEQMYREERSMNELMAAAYRISGNYDRRENSVYNMADRSRKNFPSHAIALFRVIHNPAVFINLF